MKKALLGLYFKTLGNLARIYMQKTKPYIVGINGSVGKTSCRMIVAQTLQQLLPHMDIYTSPKNFNGELGMSLSIFHIEKYTPSLLGLLLCLLQGAWKTLIAKKPIRTNILLLEYGIDHPGEMAFLLSIAKPNCSIHTQIDAVHSEQFGSPDAIAKEEFLLEGNTKEIVFLNQDDPYIHHIKNSIPCDVISYSANTETKETMISIAYETTVTKETTLSARVSFNNKKNININLNILGRYHMAYASIGVCLADILSHAYSNKPATQDGQAIYLNTTLQPGRRSIFPGKYESIIIDSSYNASPRSVKSIIKESIEWASTTHPEYHITLALGDMRELGDHAKNEHLQLAQFLQDYNAALFTVGENMRQVVIPYLQLNGKGQLTETHNYNNYEKMSEAILAYIKTNDKKQIIICKGSQNTIFIEEVVKSLLQNPKDEAFLTRQGGRWMKKKESRLRKSLHQEA